MGWDLMSEKQHICACGSGTYTVRFFMDDWNRTEERWEMDCPICKQRYQLYTYSYYDSGMSSEGQVWVLKAELAKVESIGTQLNKARNDIVDFATSRYMEAWLSYFQDAKTKKEKWRRLTDDGRRMYPSLSAFYQHTKDRSVEEYLKEEFRYINIPNILAKINVTDSYIDDNLRIIKKLEDDLQQAKHKLRREGHS
jgi:hypothetical protein